MIAHFNIDTQMDNALLNRFMDFANGNTDREWHIHLNTCGGLMSVEACLRLMISKHAHQVTITVWSAYSAGFKFIYMLSATPNALIVFMTGSGGMWHYGSRELGIDDRNKTTFNGDEFLQKKVLPHIKKEHDGIAKEVLTLEQLKRFKKGGDVYIEQEQLLKIFPKAIII